MAYTQYSKVEAKRRLKPRKGWVVHTVRRWYVHRTSQPIGRAVDKLTSQPTAFFPFSLFPLPSRPIFSLFCVINAQTHHPCVPGAKTGLARTSILLPPPSSSQAVHHKSTSTRERPRFSFWPLALFPIQSVQPSSHPEVPVLS